MAKRTKTGTTPGGRKYETTRYANGIKYTEVSERNNNLTGGDRTYSKVTTSKGGKGTKRNYGRSAGSSPGVIKRIIEKGPTKKR